MLKKCFFPLLLLLVVSKAQAGFVFDNTCTEAYKAMMSLRINEAKALIQKAKQQNSGNGIPIVLDNYIDYFTLLVADNKNEYERLKDNRNARIDALEELDKNSPYYLYSQAEVYLQWGLLKGRFGDYMSSGRDLKKANSLLKENMEKYPDFIPNKKGIALINVVFGSLPSNLKTISNFLGMSGNAQLGIKQMEALRTELARSKYSMFKDEIIYFLCYIDIDLLHRKDCYDKLITYLVGFENDGMLKTYLEGYVAIKTAHNEEAVNFFQAAPTSAQYLEVPLLDYYLGIAKLNRMDNDAPTYFNKYLREYKGINFVKDTYLKLAYFYLLRNDAAKYQYYLKQVKSKGYATDEKDKQALKEANDAAPDTDLLKARFLFDGGYYNKALGQYRNKNVNSLRLQRDKIEYYYRLGRIYDAMEHDEEAVNNYQKAIELGKNTSYYYAANAALSIGKIYERKHDNPRAASFYRQAIEMKDHEYKNSIDYEAKEALKRLNQ